MSFDPRGTWARDAHPDALHGQALRRAERHVVLHTSHGHVTVTGDQIARIESNNRDAIARAKKETMATENPATAIINKALAATGLTPEASVAELLEALGAGAEVLSARERLFLERNGGLATERLKSYLKTRRQMRSSPKARWAL